jgi:hypothetical protein
MPRKRHPSPEALLQSVISDLEDDYPPTYRRAVLALLSQGPLLCSDTFRRELEQPATEQWDVGVVRSDSIVRAELLAFLRDLVRKDGTGLTGYGISMGGPIKFVARAVGGRVTYEADGPMRDVVVQQMLMLLQSVGLRNVRKCAADDCEHLYVKTYRRRFHAVRCQKRILARKLRQEEHEEREQRARAKRRRITKGTR